MITKITEWAECLPDIKKRIYGADVSHKSCFAFGECPEITVEVPRKLGASAVVLRVRKDGQCDKDLPFFFLNTDGGIDTYVLLLDTKNLCDGDKDGLFFYEILFLRGSDTLFTSSINNVDFELKSYSDRRFSMLIYQKGLKVPEWFKGRTMYQVFVDRFFKGAGKVGERDDVIINDDWDNGIPQYVERQGEPLKNNMFFGGNLWGVAEKIDYLKSLGIGVIYLNPIFKAYSNHKYDTADYLCIDAMFGGKEAFDNLVKKAKEADIRIILDGVFNHTGDNSLYFDRYGEYGSDGAYKSTASRYREWYKFNDKSGEEQEYESWWGIKVLPRLNHDCDDCRRFFTGENGVGVKYIKDGISGWRLDVADELSDKFLDEFCSSVKKESDGEAVIIGEVWENAAEKESYGKRRKYLRGSQLDSVMNYPLRNAILDFVLNGNSKFLSDTLKSIYSLYPKPVCDSLMNILGTHDTERVLTVCGKGTSEVCTDSGSALARRRMSREQKKSATKKLMIAAVIQYTVYGVPSLYYGDEAGLEGYHDPFCRLPYPWGREDKKILDFYKRLGEIRGESRELFAEGEFRVLCSENALIAFERYTSEERLLIVANAQDREAEYAPDGFWRNILSDEKYNGRVSGYGCAILKRE